MLGKRQYWTHWQQRRAGPVLFLLPCGMAAGGAIAAAHLMIIRDRVILYAQPGAIPEPALEDLIATAREVDMDEVRASMAGQKAGTA
jgi:hypothetical protein